MSVHIELDGTYAVCNHEICELPIHLPLDTAEEARVLPYIALLTLIEAFDPPTLTLVSGTKVWRDTEDHFHRDFDLPAVVHADGSLVWLHHGLRHRLHDRPAIVRRDGTFEWWVNGENRDGLLDYSIATSSDGASA
jgi:hypothetical protein